MSKPLNELIFDLDVCHDILKDAVAGNDQPLIEGKLQDLGDIIRELGEWKTQ